MLKGFKEFIMRGNVIDLAVAVVIGAAFTAVVGAIVTNLINPLIGAVFSAKDLDKALIVTLGGGAQLKFGAVLAALITFVIVAAVVYFAFVVPINALRRRAEARRAQGEAPADEPVNELTLLAEIRDLLSGATDARAGRHSD